MTKEEIRITGLLDKEFLDRLAEIAKLYGWSGDYHEIRDFIECLYELNESDAPNLDPYEITE